MVGFVSQAMRVSVIGVSHVDLLCCGIHLLDEKRSAEDFLVNLVVLSVR